MFLPTLVVEVAGSLGAWQRWRPASGTGVIMLFRQKAALSRAHAGQTLTIAVSTPPWPRRPGGRTGLKCRQDGGVRAVWRFPVQMPLCRYRRCCPYLRVGALLCKL